MNSAPRAEWWRPPPVAAFAPALAAASTPAARTSSGRLSFRALLAFTFILVLAPQAYFPPLRPLRIALIAAVAGIGAQLIERLRHGQPVTVSAREIWLTAGLVAWAVVTIPFSYWPGGSTSFLLDAYFKTVAIFWLLANAVDSLDRLRTLAWCLTAMGVPLALTAMKNFLSGAFIATDRIVGYDAGLTSNPNDLALMLNLLLALGVGLLLSSRTTIERAILISIVLLEAAGVVVTFSRAGFLSLSAGLALGLWRLFRRGAAGWALAGVLACGVGAALLPGSYMARLATITDIDADPTGSAQARWGDTLAALQFVRDHPLVGAGVGMDTLALNEVRGALWKEVHNAYLEYAVDLGLPGLALFAVLFACCVRRVRFVRRHTGPEPGSWELSCLAEGIEIALLAFGVGALFSPVAYQFYFYYLAGIAVAAGRIHRTLRPAEYGRREWASAS